MNDWRRAWRSSAAADWIARVTRDSVVWRPVSAIAGAVRELWSGVSRARPHSGVVSALDRIGTASPSALDAAITQVWEASWLGASVRAHTGRWRTAWTHGRFGTVCRHLRALPPASLRQCAGWGLVSAVGVQTGGSLLLAVAAGPGEWAGRVVLLVVGLALLRFPRGAGA